MSDHRLGLRTFTDEVRNRRLPVEGSLPAWLSGHLLRNGPGRFELGEQTVAHWFDGLALLRSFEIRDGAVTYTARFLDSEAASAADAGHLGYAEFGTNPPYSLPRRLLQALRGPLSDNAVVSVSRVGGHLAAVTETDRSVLLDPDLETRRTHDPGEPDVVATLAHTHYDFARERTVGLGVDYGPDGGYAVYRRPKGETAREVVARIPVDRPAYLHSFALTDRYAVVTEPPYRLQVDRLLSGAPFAEAFRWEPEEGTRFLVVERATGRVAARLRTDPFFLFHHANAFEPDGDGDVVLDLVTFPDAGIVRSLYLDRLRTTRIQPPGGRLRRVRLSLSAGTVESETLYPGPMAFPTIDYAGRNTRRHRYVYGTARSDGEPDFLNRVLKVDTETGAATTWHDPGSYPGEPLFVPAPDGADEDDGVLLTVVLDTDAERSVLVVLDATDLTERARAPLPHALPFGFHGQFFGDEGHPKPSMA